eukprot:COSAG05_NODE_1233_length_5439_cov_3.436891_1_plen_562_part_00
MPAVRARCAADLGLLAGEPPLRRRRRTPGLSGFRETHFDRTAALACRTEIICQTYSRFRLADRVLGPPGLNTAAEAQGSSWGGSSRRVPAARDVVVDIQFDRDGALAAAVCRDGRVQVHDFDAFATGQLLRHQELGACAELPAHVASGLPRVCPDTEVLTLASAGENGTGVAWDPGDQNCLWTWHDSSNTVQMYDLEQYDPSAPQSSATFKPAQSSRGSVGLAAAQFASAQSSIASTVFVGGCAGSVFIYDKRTRRVPIHTIEQQRGPISSMQLTEDGQLLLFSTRGSRGLCSTLFGFDLRAALSPPSREASRAFGARAEARGCVLAYPVDASFRAPRPARASQDDISWVVDDASGLRVAAIRKTGMTGGAGGWTFGDSRTAGNANAIPLSTICLSPYDTSALAYQLEDGSVGQIDITRLQSATVSGNGSGGALDRGITSGGMCSPRHLPFTYGPLPAQRRFRPGFTPAAGNGTSFFYHDTHALLGNSISLRNFCRPPRHNSSAEALDDALSATLWQAEHPAAQLHLAGIARPSALAFHPSMPGDVLIGGEHECIFVVGGR